MQIIAKRSTLWEELLDGGSGASRSAGKIDP
jgi:hypothetical protein